MGRRVVSRTKNRGAGGAGVLTRAKSLALYGVTTTSSYLDLRSRRLEKKTTLLISKKKQHKPNPSSLKTTIAVASTNTTESSADSALMQGDNAPASDAATGKEARESTPCHLIRDSNILPAPSSSNKHTSESTIDQPGGLSCQRVVPSEREIDDLFGKPEELQQKNFIEKYNFDPVTEQPLPGRYEWEKLDPPK